MGKVKWPQVDRLTKACAVSLVNGPDLARRITGDTFYAWDGEVLVLNVLGKPAAARGAIGKVQGTQLKVSVTAAPEAGRSTDHMLHCLAPLFGIRGADIAVVFGRKSVNKQLRIRSPKRMPAVLGLASPQAAPA